MPRNPLVTIICARPAGRTIAVLTAALLLGGSPAPVLAQVAGPTRNQPPSKRETLPAPKPTTRVERSVGPPLTESPPDFQPWWQDQVSRKMTDSPEPLAINIDGLIFGTLRHSSQVRVLSEAPLLRQMAVTEELAKFDARTFMDHKFLNTNDPVGSTLTTGGASRFLDQNYYSAGGVRRRTSTGAQVELSQRIGTEQQNSIYFVPAQQGTSRMTLSLTQPLLNGAGCAYNNSLIVLAEIDASIARSQLSKDLQELLVEVHRRYWDLYVQRAALAQRRHLYRQATSILQDLDGRRDVDVLGSQIVRAKAALANREAATIRYAAAVRNAESRLRALTNDPRLLAGDRLELIPAQSPNRRYMKVSLEESLVVALSHRPEIDEAGKALNASAIRVNMAQNELKPVLNAIIMTYMSGLNENYEVLQSLGDQFGRGRPSYSAGLQFEMPWGNRAAIARLKQRQVEVRQLTNQLQATVGNIRSEVEIAVREVSTTYREMQSKQRTIVAEEREIEYLGERWRLLPGDQQVAGAVLDDILSAQDRLADAEFGFTTSLVAYNMSLIQLQRVTGKLLEYEQIQSIQMSQDCLPVLEHVRFGDENFPADHAADSRAKRPQGPSATGATAARRDLQPSPSMR